MTEMRGKVWKITQSGMKFVTNHDRARTLYEELLPHSTESIQIVTNA